VQRQLESAKTRSVVEILVLSGEVHPHNPRRQQWLRHIADICELAIALGFLPHTNVGPLQFEEMALLKQVNVSMGLMLEQVSTTLLKGVHRHAPSKVPTLRLQQLEQAGQLKIPFTTGLLLGIGESANDRIETLQAIANVHHRWGHIQEVILQPHQPGSQQSETHPAFSASELTDFVSTARQYLPNDITIQIPPNLVTDPTYVLHAIMQGARDLGGLGPIDEVNPDYPHPAPRTLQHLLKKNGWVLQPRLPIYPRYDSWLSATLQSTVTAWRDRLATSLLSS
jgi:FO synthase subunit 1